MTEARGPGRPEDRRVSQLADPALRFAGQSWQHSPEDAFVAVGSFRGVRLALGHFVVAECGVDAHAVEVGDKQRVVRLQAASDYRDRGAKAAVLAIENGIASLGHAHWLDADARNALDRLVKERVAVEVAVIDGMSEIVLRVPTPSGMWWRLPAKAYGSWLLAIQATPLLGFEDVFDLLDAAPAFSENEELVGFVRVVHVPGSARRVASVLRADAALAASR